MHLLNLSNSFCPHSCHKQTFLWVVARGAEVGVASCGGVTAAGPLQVGLQQQAPRYAS